MAKAPCKILKIEDRDDVSDRHGGCAVMVGEKAYLWGGEWIAVEPLAIAYEYVFRS